MDNKFLRNCSNQYTCNRKVKLENIYQIKSMKLFKQEMCLNHNKERK